MPTLILFSVSWWPISWCTLLISIGDQWKFEFIRSSRVGLFSAKIFICPSCVHYHYISKCNAYISRHNYAVTGHINPPPEYSLMQKSDEWMRYQNRTEQCDESWWKWFVTNWFHRIYIWLIRRWPHGPITSLHRDPILHHSKRGVIDYVALYVYVWSQGDPDPDTFVSLGPPSGS